MQPTLPDYDELETLVSALTGQVQDLAVALGQHCPDNDKPASIPVWPGNSDGLRRKKIYLLINSIAAQVTQLTDIRRYPSWATARSRVDLAKSFTGLAKQLTRINRAACPDACDDLINYAGKFADLAKDIIHLESTFLGGNGTRVFCSTV